jgi:hypothetical protein
MWRQCQHEKCSVFSMKKESTWDVNGDLSTQESLIQGGSNMTGTDFFSKP